MLNDNSTPDRAPAISSDPRPILFSGIQELGFGSQPSAPFQPVEVLELGERFFIRDYGGKPRVGWFDEHGYLRTMSPRDFAVAYGDIRVHVGYDEDGKDITVPLPVYWMNHPQTPRYERVVFRPGVVQEEMPRGELNLWRGWPEGLNPGWDHYRLTPEGAARAYDPEYDTDDPPPGIDLLWDHLREVVCGGDEEVFYYLLALIADSLWNPGPCDVAIVMHGPEGSGKTMLARMVMEMHGLQYGITLDGPDQLVGNFNAHLMNKSIVFADEAFFSGHHGHAAKLKTIVTRDDLLVEPKGVDRFIAEKMFRLMIASNDEHVIRAGPNDRRYLVLNVDAGERNDDKNYFGAIREEWDGGGRKALFRWLTGNWWGEQVANGKFRQWPRPVTEALQRQKDLSLPGPQMVVHNMLAEGNVPCLHEADVRRDMVFVPTDLLVRETGLKQADRKALGAALSVIAENGEKPDRVYIGSGHDKRQMRGKWLPSLAECRRRWEQHLGRSVAWPTDVQSWELRPEVRVADDTPF